jgi:hypothetical protein
MFSRCQDGGGGGGGDVDVTGVGPGSNIANVYRTNSFNPSPLHSPLARGVQNIHLHFGHLKLTGPV